MRKLEMVERLIIYCDYCGKQITDNSHTSISYQSGEIDRVKLDYHSWDADNSCLEKYKAEQLEKYKANRISNYETRVEIR